MFPNNANYIINFRVLHEIIPLFLEHDEYPKGRASNNNIISFYRREHSIQ